MSKTLEQKNTRYLLMWLPLVLLLGTVLFFVMLSMHSHHMQEKQLGLKQQNIWQAFIAQPDLMSLQIPGEYTIKQGVSVSKDVLDEPRDTSLHYFQSPENVEFKILTRQYNWQGKPYQLTTYVSSKEFSHLIIKVLATEVFIFILLLLAIVIINRKSSKFLWKPFYTTIEKTGSYDVVRNPAFQLQAETGTTEFNQLNKELCGLIEKVNQAYNNQKQFVENASHEIQTPLAIIRSKLELLINEPGLTEKTAALLVDITQANERLSQMNKSLLLLAKIDNNQFPEQEPIHISEMVEKMLNNYQEHYDNFPLLKTTIEPGVFLTASPALIEILFSNLIKNAVVHNIPGGYVDVQLNNDVFAVRNSGHALSQDPQQLFERFRKGNAETKTTGLGLALANQISQLYGMGLQYDYENGIHHIRLTFHENAS